MAGHSLFKRLSACAVLACVGLLGFSATAQANATFPPRKPGFWITTMTMDMKMQGYPQAAGAANAPIVNALCTDPATDAASLKKMEELKPGCTFSLTQDGNVYTMDNSCPDPMGGTGTMVTHGTITFISDSEIVSQSTTVSPHMSATEKSDAKWSGACPAGVVPGDFGHITNGKFVKLINVLAAPAAPPAP
jgi:hypothetical protein